MLSEFHSRFNPISRLSRLQVNAKENLSSRDLSRPMAYCSGTRNRGEQRIRNFVLTNVGVVHNQFISVQIVKLSVLKMICSPDWIKRPITRLRSLLGPIPP